MTFPVLDHYLARLSDASQPATSVWLDAEGKAQGRFFNCTMTSAFQPIRALDTRRPVAFEGLARSVSATDAGLSLWKLLERAASDDESVELDRLCRMLHAINFFRQEGAGDSDLYLSVHDRLLSAVSTNHGYAFQRILDALGLPIGRIVLQLPAVTPNQGWLLNYVADNYRRNGFGVAVNVTRAEEAMATMARLQPAAFKIESSALSNPDAVAELLALSRATNVKVIFKRVDTERVLGQLQDMAERSGVPVLVQGYLLDTPAAGIGRAAAAATQAPSAAAA